jgi:hypothetical protein
LVLQEQAAVAGDMNIRPVAVGLARAKREFKGHEIDCFVVEDNVQAGTLARPF